MNTSRIPEDPDTRDEYGYTALERAAQEKDLVLISALIRAGANPNLRNANGDTPLQQTREAEVATALIASGADLEARHGCCLSAPLHVAVNDIAYFTRDTNHANRDLTRALLAAGADVNATDTLGQSALHRTQDPVTAAMLVKAGAALESRAQTGRTPLHAANRDVTNFLITSGANVDAIDNLGNTPLHLTDDPHTAAILVKAGADLSIKNASGHTPSDCASPEKLSAMQAEQRALRAGSLDSLYAALDVPADPVAPRPSRVRQRC
jgi:cytohesin